MANKSGVLNGQRFGKWTVIGAAPRSSRESRYLCRCDCGTERDVLRKHLLSGKSTSCGCQRHLQAAAITTHGGSKTSEYRTWQAMRNRCTDPKNPGWLRYGGRGISVDPRWDAFAAFLADMGAKPSPAHTLDRVDGDGDYTPENCRWATRREQAQNTSRNHYVTWNGETKSIAEWARTTGINKDAIRYRLLAGWSAEETLTRPRRV